MAFSGNYMCTSFKKELLYGAHDFDASSGDTFKIALYTNSATLNAATTAYTTSGQTTGTNYSAGGEPPVLLILQMKLSLTSVLRREVL